MIAVRVPGGLPRWFDPEDDRMCRIAWSRLAEPGDHEAWGLVARLGAGSALRSVLEGGGSGAQRRESVIPGRWLVRLPDADPRRDLLLAERVGARVLVPGDAQWPAGVDDLGDERPFCLWARGPLDLAEACRDAVAMVGARSCTSYGETVTRELAAGCVEHGMTVVSGAAYGIDAVAHRAALANGGRTVAVLACGIDRVYPRGNEALIERIAQDGCVVGEVPPNSAPTRWRFIERNRLIAALSTGTIVVEAAWRSGALGTASRAGRLGRPVGAVPGPVTAAMSAGCHRLLRDGATCVTDAGEVVELLSPVGARPAPERSGMPAEHDGLSAVDLRVYDALPLRRAVGIASLARTAGLPESDVAAALGRLEILDLALRVEAAWRRRPPDTADDRARAR